MVATHTNPLADFQWNRQPDAEAFVHRFLETFLAKNSFAAALAARMTADTGTRFLDWIDAIFPIPTADLETQLPPLGFTPDPNDRRIFRNSSGIFPAVVLDHHDPHAHHASSTGVFLKVDSAADFLVANHLDTPIVGEPFAPYRHARISAENNTWLSIAQRRGHAHFSPQPSNPAKRLAAASALEKFRTRRRHFATADEGFAHAHRLIDAAIADLGVHQTCALFFAAEREYWQSRNRAAQVQKSRQDRLGLGWGNHDHHTYRSSRASFATLIAFFEKLGLTCRERFYAGRDAGWGAQVMENPTAGVITFNDVDLSPEEIIHDFAHSPLPEINGDAASFSPRSLGTVGLWCGLHGEAFLEAGMHHLECQFDFDALREQLARDHQINTMKPFTDFPFLRQAFTEGERWPVAEEKLTRLLAAKLITPEQAEKFRTQGAIGSHLENLQRDEGYKGFNQKGISEIITATDPRKLAAT